MSSQLEQIRKHFAAERKAEWAEKSAESFESTLFAELKRGDEFIMLPKPGSNNPGDFRGIHDVFKKIEQVQIADTGICINAISLASGRTVSSSPEFAVIKLNR